MSALVDRINTTDREEIAVLVVDDVLPIVEEMLTLLELRNIPAAAAASLDEATLALRECPNITVIVCDVRLGRDSGFDLAERVKANDALRSRKLEYIFVTGDPTGIEHFRENFAPIILTKPVRPHELVGLIRQLLERSG